MNRTIVVVVTEAGYDDGFSAAVTATSAGIGPIIPPSISFVIYGSMTSISILTLFMAHHEQDHRGGGH